MENQKKGKKYLVIILIALLLGSVVTDFMLWSKKNQVITVIQHKTDTLIVEQNALKEKIKSRSAELQVFKGRSKELDKLVAQGTVRITQLEEEIAGMGTPEPGDDAKRKELERKIAELNKVDKIYLREIEKLLNEGYVYKKQKDSLVTKLTKTNEDRFDLQDKVDVAGALKVEYLVITPMKKKVLRAKEESTTSAWLVNSFRTCFTILDNKLAPVGKRTAYVRIVSPEGKVVGWTATGKFRSGGGNDIQFTTTKVFQFSGARQNLCLDYIANSADKFPAGKYIVEVYMDSGLATSGSVYLK
jgi:hypothetical protein